MHKKYVAHIFAKFEYFLEEVKRCSNLENKTIYYSTWFKRRGNFVDYDFKVIYIDARTLPIEIFEYSIWGYVEVEKAIKVIKKDFKRFIKILKKLAKMGFNVTKISPEEFNKIIDELYIKLTNKPHYYVLL